MSFLSFKNQNTRRGPYQWWSILTYLMFGLMAGSLLMSSILVYNYTFRTLEDAHTIVLLNADSVVNNINMEAYKKAVTAISLKKNPSGFTPDVRNIFSYKQIGGFSTSTSSSPSYVSTSTP